MNFNLNKKNLFFLNIFLITVFCSIMLIVYTSLKESRSNQIQQSVDNELLYVETSILETLIQSIEELKAISTILIFRPNTSLLEFQNYAKEQIRQQSDDLIIEWQPIIKHKDRVSFEKKAKEQGMKDFFLWEPNEYGKAIPAKIKDEYVPVYYMLSNSIDINTLGIDLAWSKERMVSKYVARDLGTAQASNLFKVVTSKTKKHNPIGFAITFPVYKDGLIPNNINQRKKNILGYLAGVYSLQSMFQTLLEEVDNKKLILSIKSLGNKELAFIQNNWSSSSYNNSIIIDIYGSKWEINLVASKSYIEENFSKKQFYMLAVQFILGLFIIIILNALYLKSYKLRNNEIQITKEKNKSQHYLDIAGTIIIALDEKGIITLVNQECCKILEAKENDLIGKNWFENFLIPEEVDYVKKVFSKIIQGEIDNLRYVENKIKTYKGNIKLISWRNSVIKNDNDQIIGLLSSGLDITKQKENENELKLKSQESMLFRNIVNSVNIGVSVSDASKGEDHKTIYVNKAFEKMTGYTQDEILGKNLRLLQGEDKNQDEIAIMSESIKKKESCQVEIRNYKKDGTLFFNFVSLHPMFNKDEELVNYIGLQHDVTNKKLNEIKILQQKEEFESIFNSALNGIAIVDLDGNFVKTNQAFLEITGYDEKDILSKNCSELTTDEYQEINDKAIDTTIKKGSVKNIEKVCTKKDKTTIDITMNMVLLPDKQSILIMIHDTTALKLLQEQSKLASLGEMIGNIAHQWRQPLSMITASISALRLQSDLGEKITKKDIVKFSNIIENQALYLSDTIDNFRNFINSDLSYKNVSLNESLTNAIKLVDASLKTNFISLNIDLDDEIQVYGNSNELSQAFINILNNAKDILKEKVQLEEDRLIFISTIKKDPDQVIVKIKDTGGGIQKEIKDKIFEPYFTTKHAYVGTGLGLSIAYKILVERHQAEIFVSNEKFLYNGKHYNGACFTITMQRV